MTANPLPHQARTGSENCLDIGTRVAEFEITSIIGEGGFGTVYLAVDHSLQRTVALKEYLPPALASRGIDQNVAVRSKRHQETFDAGLKSFINEARLLAQFDHPALIKVHRFWEQNNTAYMAMRFYEGKTLKDIISDQPAIATEAWWKSILKPILEALDVLYSAQILHRDISPENIMIQPSGEPILLDFGAARRVIDNMSQALTVILKPGYAPIEQYADDPSMKQGPWTDIYALCAVIFATITKKAPPASIARMIKDPMEPLTPSAYPGYSAQFLFALNKGLCVKPDDRPQTIAEFGKLLGLDDLASGATSTAPVSKNHTTDSKRSSDRSKTPVATVEKKISAGTGTSAASKEHRQHTANARTTAVKPVKTSAHRKWIIGGAGIASIAVLAMIFFATRTNAPLTNSALVAETTVAPEVEVLTSGDPIQASAPPPLDEANSLNMSSPSGQTDLSAPAPIDQKAIKANDKRSRTISRDAGKSAANLQQAPSRPLKDTTKEPGTIQLNIKPWGTILVDGISKGVSPPLKKLDLPEGKYQIRVLNPNFPDHVINVDIKNQKTVRIDHNFSRTKN